MIHEKQLLVYFASPYSSEIPMIVARRYQEVFQITAEALLRDTRIVPFSPIVYTHQFGHLNIDWLQRMDFRMLDACDAALFIQMEGWTESEGMLAEKRYCQQNDIPLYYASSERVHEVCRQIWDARQEIMEANTIRHENPT